MPAKLKVFATQLGFVDVVIATTSRQKALDAWGVSQDLFKNGFAKELPDGASEAKAALEQPGVLLERRVGAKGKYAPSKRK